MSLADGHPVAREAGAAISKVPMPHAALNPSFLNKSARLPLGLRPMGMRLSPMNI